MLNVESASANGFLPPCYVKLLLTAEKANGGGGGFKFHLTFRRAWRSLSSRILEMFKFFLLLCPPDTSNSATSHNSAPKGDKSEL